MVDDPSPASGLILDVDRPGTLAYAVARLVGATYQVRDQPPRTPGSSLGRFRTRSPRHPERRDPAPTPAGSHPRIPCSPSPASSPNPWSATRRGAFDGGIRPRARHPHDDLLRHTIAETRSPVVAGQVAEAALLASESILTYRRRTARLGPASPSPRRSRCSCSTRRTRARSPVSCGGWPATWRSSATTWLWRDAGRPRRRTRRARRRGPRPRRPRPGGSPARPPERDLRAPSDGISWRHFARKATQHTLPVTWTSGGAG